MGFVENGRDARSESLKPQSRLPNPESGVAAFVRERGPLTVAAFMDLALYHPEHGYYSRAAQRSGRAGDFFTSVDVGPLFGELLAVQIAEMARLLAGRAAEPAAGAENGDCSAHSATGAVAFSVLEAGAGNGRLSADIVRALRRRDPELYNSTRLHLVEASASARSAQRATLAEVADRLAASTSELPGSFEGVLVANELLDAMPVHQVVMRDTGLREIYVIDRSRLDVRQHVRVGDEVRATTRNAATDDVRLPTANRRLPTSDCQPPTGDFRPPTDDSRPPTNDSRPPTDDSRPPTDDSRLTTVEGPLSTPALQDYLDRCGAALEPGWRAEIGLAAIDWIRDAARRLTRGFMILVDYGHEASELYSATHSAGTLTSFSRHRSGGADSAGMPPWLIDPGGRDITAHVDFTSIRAAAEAEGMTTIGLLDQTYFVMGLVQDWSAEALAHRAAALKTLMLPGGLGSTHKVLILGKGVGTPRLKGCSFKVRVT